MALFKDKVCTEIQLELFLIAKRTFYVELSKRSRRAWNEVSRLAVCTSKMFAVRFYPSWETPHYMGEMLKSSI